MLPHQPASGPGRAWRPLVEVVSAKIRSYREGPHLVAYRAIGNVPRQLVAYLAALLAAARRTRGTRAGSRALSCWRQAVFALIWCRERRPIPLIGTGLGISPATSSRYLTEATCVLAGQAGDLHAALHRVAGDGWPQVVLDGTVIAADRSRAKTTSRQGTTIDAG